MSKCEELSYKLGYLLIVELILPVHPIYHVHHDFQGLSTPISEVYIRRPY